MKLEDILTQELIENVPDVDWPTYFHEILEITTEDETRILFETANALAKVKYINPAKSNHLPVSIAQKYLEQSKASIKSKKTNFNLKLFSEEAKKVYLTGRAGIVIPSFVEDACFIIDQDKISFEEWVRIGEEFMERDGMLIGTPYFSATSELINNPYFNFHELVDMSRELMNMDNIFAGIFFEKIGKSIIGEDSLRTIKDNLRYLAKIAKNNRNAAIKYFRLLEYYSDYDKLDLINQTIDLCIDSQDYDFLKYILKLEEEPKLDELGAIQYLLTHNKSRWPKVDECKLTEITPEMKNRQRKLFRRTAQVPTNKIGGKRNTILSGPNFWGTLGKVTTEQEKMELTGYYLLEELMRRIYPLKHPFQYEPIGSSPYISEKILDKLKSRCDKGRNFKQHFTESIDSVIDCDSDDELMQFIADAKADPASEKAKAIKDMIVNQICKYKTSDEDISDLLGEFRHLLAAETKPFDEVKLWTNSNFIDDLFDDGKLDSCVFGPKGGAREACLQYACDPNIDLLFVQTYLKDQFQENIGVVYLIRTKEKVLVIDGVDGGYTLRKGLKFDWKEFVYTKLKSVLERYGGISPNRVLLNVNAGKRKAPNEFLKYVCERKGIPYTVDNDRKTIVQAKLQGTLNKPLLSESCPEAYKAIGTDLAYLDAWYNNESEGEKEWNKGQGKVEGIAMF